MGNFDSDVASPSDSLSQRTADATDRLWRAYKNGQVCHPIRDLIGSTDIENAYNVQSQLTRMRVDSGGKVVGWKRSEERRVGEEWRSGRSTTARTERTRP